MTPTLQRITQRSEGAPARTETDFEAQSFPTAIWAHPTANAAPPSRPIARWETRIERERGDLALGAPPGGTNRLESARRRDNRLG